MKIQNTLVGLGQGAVMGYTFSALGIDGTWRLCVAVAVVAVVVDVGDVIEQRERAD